jgi:hypothetical protein
MYLNTLYPNKKYDEAEPVMRKALSKESLTSLVPQDSKDNLLKPQNVQTLVYEVNVSVDMEVADAFLTALLPHTKDMMKFEGFRSCEILEDKDAASVEGAQHRTFVCVYRVENRELFDAYCRDHRDRMIAFMDKRFPGRFTAHRRVMKSAMHSTEGVHW